MKKLLYSIAGVAFAIVLSFNLSLGNSNDLASQNMLALSQAQAQVIGGGGTGGTTTCYSITSPCYIFGCSNVSFCTVDCPSQRVDEWSGANSCTYGGGNEN